MAGTPLPIAQVSVPVASGPLGGLIRKGPQTCERCQKVFTGGLGARRCLYCRYIGRTGHSRPQKYRWTPERDALMRERYDSRVSGRAAEIARDFGWPDWVVKRRAREIGLARTKPVNWSQEETAFLLEHAGVRTPLWIAKRLGRSLTAILMKVKHLHLSRRVQNGFTMRDVALCFGIDDHAVAGWIRQGLLHAERRGTARPNDALVIQEADILAFIREHPMAFRLDKVDQLWFMDLVLGGRLGGEA
jgi:hypothetical protein